MVRWLFNIQCLLDAFWLACSLLYLVMPNNLFGFLAMFETRTDACIQHFMSLQDSWMMIKDLQSISEGVCMMTAILSVCSGILLLLMLFIFHFTA